MKKNQDKIKDYRKNFIAWRSILRNTLKRMGTEKEDYTNILLGYSALELKIHIEKLFTSGMCWSNYGEWYIDHIKPVNSFNKNTSPSIVCSLKIYNHYGLLQKI